MRLSVAAVNRMIDVTAQSLNAGALVFYGGARPAITSADLELQVEIARVTLPSPAFAPADGGKATSYDLPETTVLATDTVRWARYVTALGQVVADVLVRAEDDPDVDDADIVVERSDFHRGGIFRLAPVVLTMPRTS